MVSGKKRTALVTGGTGFIGSHLVRRLVKEQWRIHVITRPNSNFDSLESVINKINIHEYDETTESLCNIVESANPDIVFHLASLFLVRHETIDIIPLIQSNILFSTQLLESMLQNKVSLLVNAGTSWQHYNNEDYCPVNLYAATKQAFESILKYYIDIKALRVITLKLFDTYGPDDKRFKILNLLKKIKESSEPLRMSPGEQMIDLVYIDDVINAFIIASERLLSGQVQEDETYAISSNSPISLKNLIELFEQIVGQKLPIIWAGRPYRDREVMQTWNKGQLLPGWKPIINIETGLNYFSTEPQVEICSSCETSLSEHQ